MTDPKMPPNVRVKPLVWESPDEWENSNSRYPDGTVREWRSVRGPFAYFIHRGLFTGSFRAVFGNTQFWLGNWDTLEAAKAAAQADYDARILSALEVVEDDGTMRDALQSIAAPKYGLQGIIEDTRHDTNAFNYYAMKYWRALANRYESAAAAALTKGSTDDQA
jgi:hypothetical protein